MPSWSWPVRRSCAGRTNSGRRVRTDMLSLERVGKTYPNGVHALDAVTLGVAPGEIVVVIGGAGWGKSALLRAVSGLGTPAQGSVLLDGTAVSTPPEANGIIFHETRF